MWCKGDGRKGNDALEGKFWRLWIIWNNVLFSFYIFSEQNPDLPVTSHFLTPYYRRHLMVWVCHSSQRLRIVDICIHVHFNSSHFSNKKKHSSLEIWRALKLGFILRVSVFTHFCSGFQCGNSSYEGHFAMCSLYALLFMIYFMGFKQQNRSGKSGCFKMIWTVLWSPFGIWHCGVLYT